VSTDLVVNFAICVTRWSQDVLPTFSSPFKVRKKMRLITMESQDIHEEKQPTKLFLR